MKTKLLLSSFFLFSALLLQGQWYFTTLSEPKSTMGTVSMCNKAWFAGGTTAEGVISDVEVYDISTGLCEITGNLSIARSGSCGVACGSKLFFGGGMVSWTFFSNRVDIYDTLTQVWSTDSLIIPRFLPSAVSYGNLVVFAGGLTDMYLNSTSLVEIYDLETETWSTDDLSIERCCMASAVVCDLAIFAGGFINQENISDRVDIYNFSTQTWETATLSEPRAFCQAITLGNKVLIAGGIKAINVPSNRVDIYDASTNTWSIDSLSVPRAMVTAAIVGSRAYFTGGATFNYGWHDYSDVIDIYDDDGQTWSVEHLLIPRITYSVGVGNYLVIAGGELSATGLTELVEVFQDTLGVGLHESSVVSRQWSVISYPNPTQGIVDFRFSIDDLRWVSLKIYDLQGREVATVLDGMWYGGKGVRWDASGLPAGIYYYRLTTGDRRLTTDSGKMVKN